MIEGGFDPEAGVAITESGEIATPGRVGGHTLRHSDEGGICFANPIIVTLWMEDSSFVGMTKQGRLV